MYEGIIKNTKQQLAHLWTNEWAGRIDMEDNWIAEGSRFVNWEIRNPKAHEEWIFSMTLALAYGGISKQSPQTLAESIADYLNPLAEPGWHFRAQSGYVNAYFEPTKLSDYLRRFKALDKKALQGSYALYRLSVLKAAIEARGIAAADLMDSVSPEVIERFEWILEAPSQDSDWLIWAKRVEQLTSEGRLNGMSREAAGVLLALFKQLEI